MIYEGDNDNEGRKFCFGLVEEEVSDGTDGETDGGGFEDPRGIGVGTRTTPDTQRGSSDSRGDPPCPLTD